MAAIVEIGVDENAEVRWSGDPLVRTWERVRSWGDGDLWLKIGDDLCSLGRVGALFVLKDTVLPTGGPDAAVIVDRARYERLKAAATMARDEWGAESRVGLLDGDLD